MLRLLSLGVIALALAGCGSGERVFDPIELVSELNANGAGLTLGGALSTSQENATVMALSFGGGGNGAVTTMADADEARDELARCEGAVSFTCFRIANGVIRFEGIRPRDQTRLSLAMMELESS